MYDTILVPLDGSGESRAALTFAAGLPAERVRLLRVADDTTSAVDLAVAPSSGGREDISEQLTAQLRDAAAGSGLPESKVEIVVRFGEPAEVIIEESSSADLIVMTTRGRGAAGRAVFGSTADRVSRHGTVPTLLLRTERDGAELPVPTRVVVALDGSPLAETALPAATEMANALGVPIHLVRVVDPMSIFTTFGREYEAIGTSVLTMSPAYDEAREQREQEAADYLSATVASLASSTPVTTEHRTGTPSFTLLDLAQAEDVLVLTSHGRGGISRWLLGSVAEKLVRESKSPVLLVPARGGDGQ
jgi:nucleotide-binding universal stress UspA family protein